MVRTTVVFCSILVSVVIAVGAVMTLSHQSATVVQQQHFSGVLYPQGSLGYYTSNGNPICVYVSHYPDPNHSAQEIYALNLLPYYGKRPSSLWHPTGHMMPLARAQGLCHRIGALLWHFKST